MKKCNLTAILFKYLLPVFLLAMLLLTLFRVYFVYLFSDDFIILYKTWGDLQPTLLKAMVKGIRYDLIVVSYAMIFPLIVLLICTISKISFKVYVFITRIYLILAFAFIFALSCVDFPYFKYFWTHPTLSVFNWVGAGGTFGMLVEESSYYVYYLLFVISVGLISFFSIYLSSRLLNNKRLIEVNCKVEGVIFLLTCVLCFFGTRGQLNKNPLGVGAAFFTDNNLVSNLCLTPAYYFVAYLDSYEVDIEQLIPLSNALEAVRIQLGIVAINDDFENPISRRIDGDDKKEVREYNIVLVYLESMSTALLHQKHQGKAVTPYLDSIITKSYYFENFYSSGVHTNCGVGSTLASYPSRFNKHMMNRVPPRYHGLGVTLKEKGYQSAFFLPNEKVYDNMDLFLIQNGFDTIFSDVNYPKEKRANNFGVADDYLLNFALDEMNKMYAIKKPFLANILTVSNHPPYVVPSEFKDRGEDDQQSILSFVDHSLQSFMEKASKEDWYENTIFIFQGDHGKIVGDQKYNMQLSYNHIPLIVYCPSFEDMPQRFTEFGGQIDIYPTVLGLMNMPYTNNTLGVDLLKEKRPYMYFTSDTHMGCISDDYFYVLDPRDSNEYLYDLSDPSSNNLINHFGAKADSMRNYANSMLVTADFLEKERLVERY